MSKASNEFWKSANVGREYNDNPMDRVTAMPAMKMLENSGVLEAATKGTKLQILDNACGTGVVTELLFSKLPKDSFNLTATDLGPSMIDATKAKIEQNGWQGNATALVADMLDLSALKDNHYDYIFTNLGINFPQDSSKVLSEIHRISAPGAVNAFTTLNHVGWIPIVKAAFAQYIPSAKPFPSQDEGFRHMSGGKTHWDDEKWIKEQLSATGWGNISIELNKIDHKIPRETFVKVFGGPMMKGMMGMFGFTKEEVAEIGDKIAPALEQYLKETGQEEVLMPMYAWVTTATKKA